MNMKSNTKKCPSCDSFNLRNKGRHRDGINTWYKCKDCNQRFLYNTKNTEKKMPKKNQKRSSATHINANTKTINKGTEKPTHLNDKAINIIKVTRSYFDLLIMVCRHIYKNNDMSCFQNFDNAQQKIHISHIFGFNKFVEKYNSEFDSNLSDIYTFYVNTNASDYSYFWLHRMSPSYKLKEIDFSEMNTISSLKEMTEILDKYQAAINTKHKELTDLLDTLKNALG